MRVLLLAAMILLQGCAGTMAVRTLESTIRDAALVAQSATQGASDKLKIEVRVTHGYRVGGSVPVPVVPIAVSQTGSTYTKLTLEVDLDKFDPTSVKGAEEAEEIFILDTRTGELSLPPQ